MVSERMRRQLELLLDEADAAVRNDDWRLVANRARAALAIEADNADALTFLKMAEANLTTPPAPASDAAPSPTPAPALPESFAGGRYRVVRFLGEGGKKKVYLAHDALLDRDVAFSLIKSDGLDATGRERVLREARAMGRLTNPHIVGIYDAGESDGTPYFVQELMAGGDLEGLLKTGTPTLARTLELAIGVCRGLEYAHAQGIVHRDLKPGNVWLSADGAPKLGDLGLAVSLDDTRLTTHGMMVGTYQYMPPEQALGHDVDARADLYSLGCMLYELVTGRTPFPGDTPTAVISQHLNAAPVAPSWHSDHCPPALEALILRLLAKRPEERPASAAEVRAVLETIDPEEKSLPRSDSSANPLDALARGVFVGREKELEQLYRAVDRAFQGRGSVVMLVGEPGIGKTRTVQELETYARMRGAEVYWGRTHESSGMPAYWPWLQVGRAWGQGHDVALAAAQGAFGSGELVRLFPELANIPAMPAPADEADPESAQFRLFDAYTQFARGQASERPWVIVLDDLHWADKPTLQLLQYLARELANMRVLVVGTYRDTELSRTHPLSEALAELNRSGGFQRVVLRGLSRNEVGAYIRQQAASEPAPALIDRVFEETEGNPFFLAEVVNLLAQEGTLDSGSVSDIALPDGVREALGRRLDRLSPEANALLGVAAIVGREFAYETLNLLEQHEPDELLRLIEEALAARVIEEAGQAGRYRFTHALMQETLLDELSTTRRVRLHGQVAEALERRYGDRADDYATILALHYAESATLTPQHVVKAVHYLVAAGKQAEVQFAWAEAARFYERAVTCIDETARLEFDAVLPRVLSDLAKCRVSVGDYRDAWRTLNRALDLYRRLDDGVGFARVLDFNEPTGAFPLARMAALLEEGLDRVDDRNETVVAALAMQAGGVGVRGFIGPERSDQLFERATEIIERLQLRERNQRLATIRAFRLQTDGAFQDAIAVGEKAQLPTLAMLTLYVGDVTAAEARMRRRLDDPGTPPGARTIEGAQWGIFLLSAGRFQEFDELSRAYPAEGATAYWRMAHALRSLYVGDVQLALRLVPDTEQVGREPYMLSQVHPMRGRVFWLCGQVDQARHEMRGYRETLSAAGFSSLDAGQDFDGRGIAPNSWPEAFDSGLPLLATARELEGLRAIVRFEPGATKVRSYWGLCGPRVHGDWAVALNMIEDADRHYRTALDWCRSESVAIEEGRCLQGLAELAERAGRIEEARAHLDVAGEIFARTGAKFFLDQVIAKKEILRA